MTVVHTASGRKGTSDCRERESRGRKLQVGNGPHGVPLGTFHLQLWSRARSFCVEGGKLLDKLNRSRTKQCRIGLELDVHLIDMHELHTCLKELAQIKLLQARGIAKNKPNAMSKKSKAILLGMVGPLFRCALRCKRDAEMLETAIKSIEVSLGAMGYRK